MLIPNKSKGNVLLEFRRKCSRSYPACILAFDGCKFCTGSDLGGQYQAGATFGDVASEVDAGDYFLADVAAFVVGDEAVEPKFGTMVVSSISTPYFGMPFSIRSVS
jgi:hypothetical protein